MLPWLSLKQSFPFADFCAKAEAIKPQAAGMLPPSDEMLPQVTPCSQHCGQLQSMPVLT